MRLKKIYTVSLLSILFGCIFGNETTVIPIVDNYYLCYTNGSRDDVYLSTKLANGDLVGVVPSSIRFLGYNSRFVVAVQSESNSGPDSAKFKYFVLSVRQKEVDTTLQIGPLTKSEYQERAIELDIGEVKLKEVKSGR